MLSGKVTFVGDVGVWFSVGVVKDGLMPLRLLREGTRKLRIGDLVDGLTVHVVDLERERFTLSGEGLEVISPALSGETEAEWMHAAAKII